MLKIVEKNFHSSEYRCVYDIKNTNIRKNEEDILSILLGYMQCKSQFLGIGKKIRNARNNSFMFIEKAKLTKKIDSSLSNKNICSYSKIQIPIMHRDFLKTIYNNRDYVKTFCNDLNNPFHFACRRWILHSQTI